MTPISAFIISQPKWIRSQATFEHATDVLILQENLQGKTQRHHERRVVDSILPNFRASALLRNWRQSGSSSYEKSKLFMSQVAA